MRFFRHLLVGSLLLGVVVVGSRMVRLVEATAPSEKKAVNPAAGAAARSRTASLPNPSNASSLPTFSPQAPTAPGARFTLRRLAYAQAWNESQPPALAAFRHWTESYQHAPSADARMALEAEGVALARERRPVMRQLIIDDPQRALALTVPATVRAALPPAVRAELETRVAGKGDYLVIGAAPSTNGEVASVPPLRRLVSLAENNFTAHVYGRRADQLTKQDAPLHGVALDGELALHESPLRVLEPGEVPEYAAAAECPVSALAVAPLPPASGVNNGGDLNVVEAGGRTFEFCGAGHMLESFEQRLVAAESGNDPRVIWPAAGEPRAAAQAATSWTVGPKKVLVVRVDFSDVPGESIPAAEAQSVMDTDVKPFYERASYGQTTLLTTVTAKVYRMPQPATFYALSNNLFQLFDDGWKVTGSDYSSANFDRLIVAMPKITPSVIPGSQFTFGGVADIGGPMAVINGLFPFRTVSHELGHTYGLMHANLWRVADGNPVSSVGTSIEYGDPFEMMGGNSKCDDFCPSHKNHLGWIPDSAVLDVGKSGTYRIYRFDSQAATFDHPLALRIFRDGVRWYWIGLRENYPANDSLSNGAYIVWDFNSGQHQSQLLECDTPGTNSVNAALRIGKTLDDSDYGIKIKTLGRGGVEPAQYLDVEITITEQAPLNHVAAWGTSNGRSINPPDGLADVQAIAAGRDFALALRSDGTVVAWGGNSQYGQLEVPAGLHDVVAIAAGDDTAGAVKRDGTIELWGIDFWGNGNNRNLAEPMPLFTGVKQIALGQHLLMLKNDGTVAAWGGLNTHDELNVPAGLKDVISIAAGIGISVALKADGTVVQWGRFAAPAGVKNIIGLSAANSTVLALKADGTVVKWDANGISPTLPASFSNVIAIAARGRPLGLKPDGTLVESGSISGASIPPGLARCRAIASGDIASFALIGPQPVVTGNPENQAAIAGGNVTFTATAVGSNAITYQWRRNGIAILGANGPTLTLNNVQRDDTGIYSVTISDAGSFVASLPATLLVTGGDPPSTGNSEARLANLSTRAIVGTGADILIPGFAITGTGQKQLIVRVSGPALVAQGVGGTLARPQLRFYNGSTLVAENTGWSSGGAANTNALLNAFAQVGLPAFPNGSADCALLVTVSPGIYTATISGVGDTTGAVLVEAYEFGVGGARLAALSCRARVGTGSDLLIPGITIAGAGTKRVIIRASGPALADQGVGGVLAKPLLEIYGESGKITENAGWSSSENVTDLMLATAAVGLSPFTPGSADCAMLLTLTPGNYTAKVSGLSNTTGVALVEVYEVP